MRQHLRPLAVRLRAAGFHHEVRRRQLQPERFPRHRSPDEPHRPHALRVRLALEVGPRRGEVGRLRRRLPLRHPAHGEADAGVGFDGLGRRRERRPPRLLPRVLHQRAGRVEEEQHRHLRRLPRGRGGGHVRGVGQLAGQLHSTEERFALAAGREQVRGVRVERERHRLAVEGAPEYRAATHPHQLGGAGRQRDRDRLGVRVLDGEREVGRGGVEEGDRSGRGGRCREQDGEEGEAHGRSGGWVPEL